MTLEIPLALAWNANVGIPLLIAGVIVLGLVWLFGQPKKEQGKRRPAPEPAAGGHQERREPTMGHTSLADDPFFSSLDRVAQSPEHDLPEQPEQGELDMGLRQELEKLGATLAGERGNEPGQARNTPRPSSQAESIINALRSPGALFGNDAPAPAPQPTVSAAPAPAPVAPPAAEPAPREMPRSDLGRRPPQMPVDRIVTLFVVAREGELFHGPDLVVAAEKAGLEFGDMGIYHRLVDGKRELGPIFSVANMLKPGNFDLGRLESLRTPGLSFFMTLPAPIPALDAWDAMLPTAQRIAELLDGHVLDEERNALGRQRIAHIRDELRGWDRDHEGEEIIFGR
ncbi:cell division protein ZipA [Dyella ginsengisoli]|uniref:cell division protein ZipA n=1 Tax=Dyella ginsengisoli TaxID=363848 RepID=UPI0003456BB7|nr:cell division protein ZipA [Dyella ginsengisoli]